MRRKHIILNGRINVNRTHRRRRRNKAVGNNRYFMYAATKKQSRHSRNIISAYRFEDVKPVEIIAVIFAEPADYPVNRFNLF